MTDEQILRIQLSDNLWLDEYIPEELYREFIHKPHYLIGLIDPRLIDVDQFLRDRHGPVTINNWYSGGSRNWSGIRLPNKPYYSQFSQHGYGRASDKKFKLVSAEEVRQDIKDNFTELYSHLGLSCIEDGVSWVHSDVRQHTFGGYQGKGLLIVNP